ncbi:hypothetical protein [Streptomyces sp. NPDC058254]|uniref:hypothetical protein n=1 Tax=Streptomyces sp. NPDC058254 TaxID=3346406 RepID=UPI0036E1CDC2
MKSLRITASGNRAAVEIGGRRLDSALSAYTIHQQAGEPAQVVLYPSPAAENEFEGLAQVAAAATTEGSLWRPPRRWGEPLMVTEPEARGGLINGVRRSWDSLTPAERWSLVAPEGGSCLLAVKNGGGPFTAWATVFERTSDRIRARFEPRFPVRLAPPMSPHLLHEDPGIPGPRTLPAGREARAGHRRRPGPLPEQG